jgi:hypothetical protein
MALYAGSGTLPGLVRVEFAGNAARVLVSYRMLSHARTFCPFLSAFGKRVRLRKDALDTWWERVSACVAVALLMMFVIDILLRGW